MRQTGCALLTYVLLLHGLVGRTLADEGGFRWWPFGQQSESALPAAGQVSSPTAASSPPLGASEPVPSATAPWGTQQSANGQASLPPQSSNTAPEQRWMIDSPDSRVSWPRFQMPAMPEFTLPKPRLPRPNVSQLWLREMQVDEARNAWMHDSPEPARPSPLQAVRQGARRVGDSTRHAWHTTVDALTPGDDSSTSSRIARRETPLWRRMLGLGQPEPEGSRTVAEFMAQDRIDP